MQSYSASRFLPKCAGNRKASAMPSSTSCLDCAVGQVGVQEMLAGAFGGLHQVLHAVGADRLHDVGTDGLQQHGRVPPSVTKSLEPVGAHCAMRAKARIVIGGVITGIGLRSAAARRRRCAGRPGRATRASARCIRGSSRAAAPGSNRSRLPNTVPSLLYGNGPPGANQPVRLLRFGRQSRQRHGGRRSCLDAGCSRRAGLHQHRHPPPRDSKPQLAQDCHAERPIGDRNTG